MAHRRLSSDRRSLRQAHLAAGVTEAASRAVMRTGLLDVDVNAGLTLGDVLALKVAVTVSGLVFPGERRPANVMRDPRPRELAAVAAARQLLQDPQSSQSSMLLVYPENVVVAHTAADLAARVLVPTAEPYMILPVGVWLSELRAASTQDAA